MCLPKVSVKYYTRGPWIVESFNYSSSHRVWKHASKQPPPMNFVDAWKFCLPNSCVHASLCKILGQFLRNKQIDILHLCSLQLKSNNFSNHNHQVSEKLETFFFSSIFCIMISSINKRINQSLCQTFSQLCDVSDQYGGLSYYKCV